MMVATQSQLSDTQVDRQRAETYRLFASLLGREMTEPDLVVLARLALTNGTALEHEGVPANELEQCLDALAQSIPPSINADALLNLSVEYARLFLGSGGPPEAPLEESTYRGERRLYGTAATEMRQLLDQWGLEAPSQFGPEDHAAVELSLMAALAETAIGDDVKTIREATNSQSQFLRTHLLVWFPHFVERVGEKASLPFYPALVTAIGTYLKYDEQYLSERLAAAKHR